MKTTKLSMPLFKGTVCSPFDPELSADRSQLYIGNSTYMTKLGVALLIQELTLTHNQMADTKIILKKSNHGNN